MFINNHQHTSIASRISKTRKRPKAKKKFMVHLAVVSEIHKCQTAVFACMLTCQIHALQSDISWFKAIETYLSPIFTCSVSKCLSV